MKTQIINLLHHLVWADARLRDEIVCNPDCPENILNMAAHVIGAEEVWLSRIQGRPAELPVWPKLSRDQFLERVSQPSNAMLAYANALEESSLTEPVRYTNSAGLSYETPLGEILTHVALHGMYHRGQVAMLLRMSDMTPKSCDYIEFVRHDPAAKRAK